jgi:hypothetical protein
LLASEIPGRPKFFAGGSLEGTVRARWTSGAEPSVTTRAAARIVFLRSVASASKSPPTKRLKTNSQIKTTQARKLKRNALLFFRSANGRSWPITSVNAVQRYVRS